jgi:two-component system NtrC family response regulator
VGNTTPIRRIHDFILQAAPSEATVLIMGESGTGKELVAEALHTCSGRAAGPLVKVNCAALPGTLLESELFGYEKGAFTGAVKDKPGRFMLAHGGTIFLDEIAELPLETQVKLLRVLQEREVEPLGALKSVPVDVRVICATNKILSREVEGGRFREDLYFRLNVLEVVIPPLRDRLDDLPLLVSRLLDKLCRKNRKEIRSVSAEFLSALLRYAWPGNVRELENVLERALILSRSDRLMPEALPAHILNSAGVSTSDPVLPAPEAEYVPGKLNPFEEAERKALIQALREYNGRREPTAVALGISLRTLQYKLKKFGLVRSSLMPNAF